MNWNKHSADISSNKNNNRRLAVPITPELEKAIEAFKQSYPNRKFADVAVLKTMIEAGFKIWFNQQNTTKTQTQPQTAPETASEEPEPQQATLQPETPQNNTVHPNSMVQQRLEELGEHA